MNERQLYTASYVKQIKGKSTALHIVLIFTQVIDIIFFKGLNICPIYYIIMRLYENNSTIYRYNETILFRLLTILNENYTSFILINSVFTKLMIIKMKKKSDENFLRKVG